jgi:hypothetical protein
MLENEPKFDRIKMSSQTFDLLSQNLTNLPACAHLRENGKIRAYMRRDIIFELVSPRNIISSLHEIEDKPYQYSIN